MFVRHPARIVLGPILAIAIVVPGVAAAQSLFGTPAQDATSTPAPAAAPAPAPKHVVERRRRKPVVPKQATRVDVINKRQATLVELTLTSTTQKDAKPQIVARDLAGGKKVTARLAKSGGCIYSVSGTFDDKSTVEVSALDLCKDDDLDLVD